MPSLYVRNLDDKLVERLKQRAARHGRSVEAEHREILRQALAGDETLSWDDKAALLRQRIRGNAMTPSEVLIREDRDSR